MLQLFQLYPFAEFTSAGQENPAFTHGIEAVGLLYRGSWICVHHPDAGEISPGNVSGRTDMMRAAMTGLAAVGAICLAAIPGWNTATEAVPEQQSTTTDRVDDLSLLDGVWRSRGYGWLAEFRNGQVRFFDEGANLCAESADLPDTASLQGKVHVSSDGAMLRLPVHDPQYLHTFDRIDALPARCGLSGDSTPQAVLDAMIEAFTAHYAFFETRNVRWAELAQASREELQPDASTEDLMKVMGALVARVDDAHVSLEANVGGEDVAQYTGAGPTLARLERQAEEHGIDIEDMYERWERRYWERGVARLLLGGEALRAGNDQIAFGMIDGQIGYIAVRAMSGFAEDGHGPLADIEALDRVMERAMSLFQDASAVIVDASINWGGHDVVARALAGRFATEKTVGYFKYAGDDGAARPQAIYVEPSKGRRFTGPVYLVTSNVTLSAAEILTLSMRALPNVTHIGETTRGALSDILTKPLPNGWTIGLSNEVYLDHEGRAWEGRGIPPHEMVTVFSQDDVMTGHVEAIRALVRRVASEG